MPSPALDVTQRALTTSVIPRQEAHGARQAACKEDSHMDLAVSRTNSRGVIPVWTSM
jgi:hypothetical protein